jgi:ElaB/YqjD/DUF883 family membrane-anchored ribosome-binding protein
VKTDAKTTQRTQKSSNKTKTAGRHISKGENMDQNMDRSMNKATGKVEGAARDAKNVISDAKNAITDAAGKVEVPEVITDQLKALREQSQMVLDRTEDLVKSHPFYSILGAAAVGALVASMMSNKFSRSYES